METVNSKHALGAQQNTIYVTADNRVSPVNYAMKSRYVDIIQETKTYYQEVFGITLSDAQATSIFTPTAQAGSGF